MAQLSMAAVTHVLSALLVLADSLEGPPRTGRDAIASLNQDITGPAFDNQTEEAEDPANGMKVVTNTYNYFENTTFTFQDSQDGSEEPKQEYKAWRAVKSSNDPDIHIPDIGVFNTEEEQPEPPRRRRPGRKRKRRPHPPPSAVDGGLIQGEPSGPSRDGVRYNVEGGIQVEYDGQENKRPRRPQRPENHWRGEAIHDGARPYRRRGQKRRQRPYLPNLEAGPSAVAEQGYRNKHEEQHVAGQMGAKIVVVEDDYKVAPFIEEINDGLHSTNDGDQIQASGPSAEAEIEEKNKKEPKVEIINNEDENPSRNDKSYRKPYSQAKKEETDMAAAMGSSADLKALLKQSGGLSLSEVLQQKNLSLSDLLTGKQHALSVLKPSATPETENGFVPITKHVRQQESNADDKGEIRIGENVNTYKDSNVDNSDSKPRRRLPPSNKNTRQKEVVEEEVKNQINVQGEKEEAPVSRRRLPPANVSRRQRPQRREPEKVAQETTTEKNVFVPIHSRKTTSENLAKRRLEEQVVAETTEIPTDDKNLIEEEEPEEITTTTTTELPVTTTEKRVKNTETTRTRLSLKPRLRLPSVKPAPKRMLNPEIRSRGEVTKQSRTRYNVSENKIPQSDGKSRKPPIPAQAFQINIKDIFGMSDIVSAAKMITKAKSDAAVTEKYASSTQAATSTYRSFSRSTTTSTTTSKPKYSTTRGPSAKEEILEVLTDVKGGETLTKVLAERNMTLKELVEHRERGSSQVHLADIFHNASREPNPAEPFLSKSLIEPISKEIYPLKALLEGNMREVSVNNEEKSRGVANPPPMFVDLTKSSQGEDNLGIVTLFDKFSGFSHPKVFDPKDIKKDSDGSSYFTSVINVRPTDEIYRESRSGLGYQNSHKQVSQIFSSIPTYIKTEEVIEAKVVPDWGLPRHEQSIYNPNDNQADSVNVTPGSRSSPSIDKDVDGDGLIILDDIQRVEQIDNHIAQAANQQFDETLTAQDNYDDEEPGFYSKLPVAMRSAIIVSSAIVGTSLVVFLAIFVACKWRQNRRNLLRYNDSFNTGRVRSPILDGSRKGKMNSSSRSISPILISKENTYKSQKINTLDSQSQRDAQEYMWDNLRKPFQ